MPAHQRVRTVIVALLGTLALSLGAVALQAPTATAAPPTATQIDFPFDGLGKDDAPSTPNAPKTDDKAGKAEKLGGTVTSKVIDLVTGIVKCGLNIASPAVKCSI
ncbi:hypothetical protein [Nocardia sp. CS682]|uniref:hypothetical protein n=1 Tax=Nocardia sp. CS682 TaxID=1047172 RepID=UPI0010755A92|nr:hypothetical protein [Nocardia sp. CS682]QBS41000.1 hypothetical protein DMB37_13640 [Nocardia sp. CS682]